MCRRLANRREEVDARWPLSIFGLLLTTTKTKSRPSNPTLAESFYLAH